MTDPRVIDLADSARDAFALAAATFVSLVSEVRDEAWDLHALGEWTVRDLVGHASRSLTTVETYLEQTAHVIDAGDPVAYFARLLSHTPDPEGIAARGREAGRALGDEPHAALVAIHERVTDRLSRAEDETLVKTPAGGMLLLDYLPTRTFELTVHSLDLAYALGVAITVQPLPLATSLAIAAALAATRADGAQVLLALTGRLALPDRFSVI
ncbi:MAG: maleylpyruvate isomerase N-terminal domain-containing protein [Actinomycetota bacterium]